MSLTAQPLRPVAPWHSHPAANLTVRLSGGTAYHPLRHESPTQIAKPMDHIFHRAPVPRTTRLAAVHLCHAVARAVFEILAGHRGLWQLNFAVEPRCIEKLKCQQLIETRALTLDPAEGTSHGCVRTIRMELTASGAYECAAVLAFKHRVRAVALKLEPWHGRWQVTELEVL
ncbi:Rv3235 family protein [Glutamicibacter sp. MNS18]|uniref:Rv3235 family protein n=1 Tax=Glutamicibacter sp. MNS18 TaxID=2989817 RepID=UPI002236BE12|nr:Rv3235 family protein [Glutamicibacter sp. MNS18]MCW4464398.1 Rv3235 family protein [Glutamicibacter sp. MNS18]